MRVFLRSHSGTTMQTQDNIEAIKSTSPSLELNSRSCPKFNTCSANICPLDKDWRKRNHINHEKVCVYLLESSKNDAKHVFECAGLGNVYEAIAVIRPEILSSCATIKRASLRAESTGSRMTPAFLRVNKQ